MRESETFKIDPLYANGLEGPTEPPVPPWEGRPEQINVYAGHAPAPIILPTQYPLPHIGHSPRVTYLRHHQHLVESNYDYVGVLEITVVTTPLSADSMDPSTRRGGPVQYIYRARTSCKLH